MMVRRLAIGLPAILLLTVASTQMLLARTADLSPWKGGGFGMFASIDGAPFRWVRIYVFAPERSQEINVPPSLDDPAHRLVTWPRPHAMEAFARAVIAREQRQGRPVESVRIEVWRADISPSLEVVEALFRQTTVAAAGDVRPNDR